MTDTAKQEAAPETVCGTLINGPPCGRPESEHSGQIRACPDWGKQHVATFTLRTQPQGELRIPKQLFDDMVAGLDMAEIGLVNCFPGPGYYAQTLHVIRAVRDRALVLADPVVPKEGE